MIISIQFLLPLFGIVNREKKSPIFLEGDHLNPFIQPPPPSFNLTLLKRFPCETQGHFKSTHVRPINIHRLLDLIYSFLVPCVGSSIDFLASIGKVNRATSKVTAIVSEETK